ncbi:MAG: hypothetical protein ABIY70_07950 [Capsulimonas sp.]|uniref:hypothetical protein n=1 Tax=Capsulimonas sp. TaxID=2494211 RepID=UPI0032650880
MQTSELFRQSFVMPKNMAADTILRTGQDFPEQFYEEYEAISLTNIFNLVWHSKFFVDLEEICQVYITEYECYQISPRQVREIMALIDQKYLCSPNKELAVFFLSLRNMCGKALITNVSLHLEL